MGDIGSACYSTSLREEELKNKVAKDWFSAFDTTRIIGNIDFCVDIPATELALGFAAEPMLWAEAKAGNRKDIVASFVQLILTIGGSHTADKNLPPHFLGAFDAEKIAFIPYDSVLEVLGKNDFDWTVAPSDHESKEFRELYDLAKGVIDRQKLLFRYADDADALRRFIKSNFKSGRRDVTKILINKNNFTHIYRQWREAVMPFINAPWELLKKKYAVYDRDFFLAEMNIDDNGTPDVADDRVANDFYITFDARSSTPYSVKQKNEDDLFSTLAFGFKQGGLDAYASFWRRYKRPPRKDYWNFIVNRLDLLVPQDVRERKGSFFTPKKWVELSQHYLELALGPDWQDEYFIWDCAGGTGNLEAGLTNKYNIFVSTLDQQDIDVIHERIKNGTSLLAAHVFKFDFLNDSFDKLPPKLKEIIDDPEKRKKLVIYINPPYAEAGSTFAKNSKVGVSNQSAIHANYAEECGKFAKRELFAQFLMRIYKELPGCIVGQFSKLKHLQGPYFKDFRDVFKAKLKRSFVVPANTFDNVKGSFPIGFFVWDLSAHDRFEETTTDIYKETGEYIGGKVLSSYDNSKMLNDWLRPTWKKAKKPLGYLVCNGNDFQHYNEVAILSKKANNTSTFFKPITEENALMSCIYFAVRLCIAPNWLNDRDQFLCPNDDWNEDDEFKTGCLLYALLHGQNRIMSNDGVNHWIPFSEVEVDAKERFESHFMSDYLRPLRENLSSAARAVLDAGRELWRYYHAQPGANPNASFYDIRLHFQGSTVDSRGKVKMNSASADETYASLLANLRSAMKNLARQIEPKVYQYGFLRR